MKDLEKMMAKAGGKSDEKMSDQAIQAKMDVLQELMDMCKEQMSSNVKSGMDEMKKVTVMAPDEESLTEGLEVAKDITEEMPSEESDDDDMESKENLLSDMMADDEDEDSIFAKRK